MPSPLSLTELHNPNAGWYRLDVVDANGWMLALTNPIYLGPAREPDWQIVASV